MPLRMLRDWLKFMFSIPRREPMTKTEKFVQWSSLVAYCIGGFSFLAVPQLYNIILQLDYRGRSQGYIRLVGLGIVDIGLIFVIVARCDHRVNRYGTISFSMISRLIWVPATGLMLILREMAPLGFALIFMALDMCLALATLTIWCCEAEERSFRAFFKEFLAPIRSMLGLKAGGSILVCFIVGVIQTIFWYILVVRPDFAQILFKLDQFEGFASGYLSAFFYLISIHGLYHVLCANNVNRCLAPVSLSYRVLIDAPVLLGLFLVDHIEKNLFLAIMSIDLFVAIVLLLSIVGDKRTTENTAVHPIMNETITLKTTYKSTGGQE